MDLNWENIADLSKELILNFLPEKDQLTIRLVSQKDQNIVDMSCLPIGQFIRDLRTHQEQEESILHLGCKQIPFKNGEGLGLNLIISVLFKGLDFLDYQRLDIPYGTFGMIYYFDDGYISIYEGIYSSSRKITKEGIIFDFSYLLAGYKKISFGFYYKINCRYIYDDNHHKNYVYEID